MEQDFYRGRLAERGLDVDIPTGPERAMIHRVIFDELVRGEVNAESRAGFLAVIERMIGDGAEGVIAGCTEIELLVTPEDVACPYFPTTALHAQAAVDAALAG
jgi:aspartate racemase